MKYMTTLAAIGISFAFALAADGASAQWLVWPRYVAPPQCADGRCGQTYQPTQGARRTQEKAKREPAPKEEPKPAEQEPAPKVEPEAQEKPEPEKEKELLSVNRARFAAPSLEIVDACDKILDRLEARYGKPKIWKPFPIYFRRYAGDGIAGYTQYGGEGVVEVVVYESLETAVGGTLDHELTHAFFFFLLNSNFDLFLNEGLAQNSEYRRRESLRQTVYRRYGNGEFWDLDQLYGRNKYDSGLLIYHQGFSVVDFLVARGGSLWMAEFMKELVKTDDVDRTLERFYGYKNLKELQTAWTRYVESGQDRQTVGAIR